MELSKNDNQMAKGIAILGMVMLHLFCRIGNLPYTPLIWIGSKPLIYYLGLFGDLCVPIYCFCSGYAQALLFEKESESYKNSRMKRLLKFLINYWCVLIVFSIVGLFFDASNNIPGSIVDFLGNLFLFDISYNGAWWFVLTYAILVIVSPFLCKVVKKFNPIVVIAVSGVIYFIAYIFRFAIQIEMPNIVLAKIWEQIILFGTSQFSFVIGIVFFQKKLITKLRMIRLKSALKTAICIMTIVILFAVHGLEESLVVAPITGLGTMICFHVMDKSKWVEKIFMFLGKHSTNIWLVHMFFYLVIFKDLVFVAKYPIFVLLFMLVICIAVSYIIEFINSGINKIIFVKKN